ncbi:amidase [Mucilaginibacter mallensis]|uniref:Amidase n=1 Tax=Mucilaginibacter mallensis TaxID=652787 RepID=A0A1H1R8H4_MUCMA|nr:amidase [Mucilaginibacter mallensis]SDS32008.1 amidase [Mucilaginibacter mallensis]
MQRRNFIKTGSLAGITLSALSLGACKIPPSEQKQAGSSTDKNTDDFALKETTIDILQQKMKSKEYTSHAITQLYLTRINDIDKNGPKLNAVIELNPNALDMANELDKERDAGKIRGPLHGIPVLIKDNINTKDKVATTAGSLAIADNYATKDAFIINQLREAGAVILGKANLSEWANFRSTRAASAWSSKGGLTKCPYILDRNPSGSSAGSGVAVAANLCAIAIGTETDGSVVSPASVNGIVGIKPTVGLLSRSGIIPISKTQDTAGPMARTVKDAAILLGILAGVDPEDSYTLNSKGKAETDYTKFLDAKGLQGKRLGIEKTALTGNPDMEILLNGAIAVLKSKGATIVEIELDKELKDLGPLEFNVLLYEFKDGLNKYLSTANSKTKSLADVIAFNKNNATKAMPFFKQEILEQAQAKGDLNSKEYIYSLKKTTRTRQIIDTILKQNKLDAIIGPTNGFACCIDLVNGDYDNGFGFSTPPAMAGYPHITVPMGAAHHLPMGLSFFSTAYQEGEIIKLAYAYEQAAKKRGLPEFKVNLLW